MASQIGLDDDEDDDKKDVPELTSKRSPLVKKPLKLPDFMMDPEKETSVPAPGSDLFEKQKALRDQVKED